MAITVLTNAQCLVNSVDLSDHLVQVAIDHGAKTEDATVMGNDTENFLPSLKVSKIELTFRQDEASSKVAQTLFPLIGPGVAPFVVEVRPVNGARSATNPGYNFSAMLESAPPLQAGVGKISECRAVFRPAGGTAATLLRSTS